MVGDNTPAILNASPNVRISNPDSSYEDYVNQANEKHAQTWDFRGNNSNLKDDQGNYYIDPNRQLTPEDISNMRSKGAKIPEQWESLEDADISELTNTFAYNMYQDPDIHRNMKLLLKIHNKPSILFKDFKNRPLVNNTTKDKNNELV